MEKEKVNTIEMNGMRKKNYEKGKEGNLILLEKKMGKR